MTIQEQGELIFAGGLVVMAATIMGFVAYFLWLAHGGNSR